MRYVTCLWFTDLPYKTFLSEGSILTDGAARAMVTMSQATCWPTRSSCSCDNMGTWREMWSGCSSADRQVIVFLVVLHERVSADHQVEHIDELLSIVFNNYTDATSGLLPLNQRTSWVYEANQILAVSRFISLCTSNSRQRQSRMAIAEPIRGSFEPPTAMPKGKVLDIKSTQSSSPSKLGHHPHRSCAHWNRCIKPRHWSWQIGRGIWALRSIRASAWRTAQR